MDAQMYGIVIWRQKNTQRGRHTETESPGFLLYAGEKKAAQKLGGAKRNQRKAKEGQERKWVARGNGRERGKGNCRVVCGIGEMRRAPNQSTRSIRLLGQRGLCECSHTLHGAVFAPVVLQQNYQQSSLGVHLMLDDSMVTDLHRQFTSKGTHLTVIDFLFCFVSQNPVRHYNL